MPSISLHPAPVSTYSQLTARNPLPSLLQTPSGLAILEVQGTLHAPSACSDLDQDAPITGPAEIFVGHLEFPLYDASASEDTSWMKRVYFYVGKHQRLTGEVKKLPKPIAIIRKRVSGSTDADSEQLKDINAPAEAKDGEEELEIVDIVKFKILFASRPEPVGS
ncbi:MAG: hypothetical protein Q9160_003989 [Pyrenula sp. 1 TL-2023]